MFELVFLTGPRAGMVVPVTRPLVAGRSPDCSLEVPDPNASRQHCRFLFDGAVLTMMDNGSSNGTWVNEQRVPTAQLRAGDVVRLGETRLRVQAHQSGGKPAQAADPDPNNSSIFTFKEAEADLSNSMVMSLSDSPKGNARNAEARLAAIMKVSRALVDIRHLDMVLGSIIDRLFEIFAQADRCFIMLGDTVEKLEPKAIRTRGRGGGDSGVPAVSRTICRKALTTRSAVLFNEGAGDQELGLSIVSLQIRSAMTLPLVVDDRIQGVVQIDTPDPRRAFTADDLEVAVAIGQMAALAVNNARMLADVEEKTKVRDNLLRFVPGPVADQAMAGKVDLGLGGKTYTGTMLFSDVVGFTRLSESLPPDEVVAMMNDYFEHVVPCILQENGSIDKFIGDAIFAYWGFPIDPGDSTLRACTAALAMQQVLHGFNAKRFDAGRVRLGHGIGLHTGQVVWGNIGTQNSRIDATALGDAVNTASRIEHASQPGQVLISDATWAALGGRGFGWRMPPMQAKNKTEPLTLYSLRGLQLLGDEISLHVPLRCAEHPGVLIRRLADRSLVILHPPEADLAGADLVLAVPEQEPMNLGRSTVNLRLAGQPGDGRLVRSQITLPDPSLSGLLSDTPSACPFGWDRFTR